MKVTDRNTIAPALLCDDTGPKGPRSVAQQEPDRVSFSETLKKMQNTDADRIAALKAAVAEGRYEIDLEELAQAFVRKELT